MTTKKDIVKRIAEHTALTQVQTKEVVQKSFDAIIEAIVEEGRIELRNFGVFEVKVRRPRKARNPRTGQPVEVPAKTVVVFKPGRIMEEKVALLYRQRLGNPQHQPTT
jgi:nucleoid DNA-binding protein